MSLEGDENLYSRTLKSKNNHYMYQSDKKSGQYQKSVFPNTQRKNSLFTGDSEVSNAVEITPKNQQEQALLSAIYNTIAVSIFFACLGLLAILYIVLESFLKPIFWALLTSAFLFSSKRYLTDKARLRLSDIEKKENILALEFIFFPFQMIDSGINCFWAFLKKNVTHLVGLVTAVILYNVIESYYENIVNTVCLFSNSIYVVTTSVAYYSDNSYQFTLALLIGYVIGITLYWNNGENTLLFQILSFPMWISLLFHISKLMGTARPFFMFIFCVLACLGIVSLINEFLKKSKWFNPTQNELLSIFNDLDDMNASLNSSQDKSSIEEVPVNKKLDLNTSGLMNTSANKPQASNKQQPTPLSTKVLNMIMSTTSMDQSFDNSLNKIRKSIDKTSGQNPNNSDKYFYFLFWLFMIVNLRYDIYFVIAIIALIWKLTKAAVIYLFEFITSLSSFQVYVDLTTEWLNLRSAVLMPKPFIFLLQLFVKGDHRVNQWLQKSMDKIVSALIIMFLLLFIMITFVVLSMQVHSESIQLAENVFNENLYSKPQLRQWLPEKEKINRVYQEAVNSFYLYGREWLQERLKTSNSNHNATAALPLNANSSSTNETINSFLLLETQLLKQWDIIYLYLSRNNTKPGLNFTVNVTNSSSDLLGKQAEQKPNSTTTTLSKAKLYKNMKRIVSFVNGKDAFDFDRLAVLIKDNFGVLYTVLESFYLILRGNIQFLTAVLFSTTSLIFSSGFALISFGFSFIVYCTFLFYLLSLSGSLYKPFHWLSEIIILKTEFSIMSINRSQVLTNAIEESIKSVFLASFKMASFYGLFTYSVYILFGSSIAVIPAIAAGCFAVLPILATYWTALPGALELWLINDEPFKAGLFFMVLIIPSYFVDTAIYSEIKGGHPYLTGLAFAGGVYCLGLEGAIIGPIVLCLLIVIGKMLTTSRVQTNKVLDARFNNSIQIPFKTQMSDK